MVVETSFSPGGSGRDVVGRLAQHRLGPAIELCRWGLSLTWTRSSRMSASGASGCGPCHASLGPLLRPRRHRRRRRLPPGTPDPGRGRQGGLPPGESLLAGRGPRPFPGPRSSWSRCTMTSCGRGGAAGRLQARPRRTSRGSAPPSLQGRHPARGARAHRGRAGSNRNLADDDGGMGCSGRRPGARLQEELQGHGCGVRRPGR